MLKFDVVVIGGGPGGLAAAKASSSKGESVLLLEREAKLGGILKQCIHDGFGVTRFGEKLSGPEYANKEITALPKNVDVSLLTFVSGVKKLDNKFIITTVSVNGVQEIETSKVVLATGCRERTSKQVFIQGTNPTGVMSAGQAQHYINLFGKMPGKNFVILGSGDIGLIMARRITLEGGNVLGVYEIKNTPSGLMRNISQCLIDFNIPLHLSYTVTRVFGVNRLEAIEIAKVDDKMRVIPNTNEIIKCDTLILSVGLIPENEIAKEFKVPLNPLTKGPSVDQDFMTLINGIYSCGNATHVNDLADYVSESGEICGSSASIKELAKRDLIDVNIDNKLAYVVPNKINVNGNLDKIIFYFRVRNEARNVVVHCLADGNEIFKKVYQVVRPPEMERIVLSLPKGLKNISFTLEDK